MEDKNKEKWMDNVLESFDGMERATPSESLFLKIEQQLEKGVGKVISMRQWSIAAAIAVVVVFANVTTFRQLALKSTTYSEVVISEDFADQSLISNYYIYD